MVKENKITQIDIETTERIRETYSDKSLEQKRKEYREYLKKNPPIIDENTGQEMKECEGCYCRISVTCRYDFCFDCLDCDGMGCNEYKLGYGNCCACFGGKNKKLNLKRKKLTFSQQQRLHWEQVKQNAEDKIEEIKDYEEPDYQMQTARDIENMHRWSEQEKQRTIKSLTIEELYQEIERKKSLHKKKLSNATGVIKKLTSESLMI